MDRYSSVEMKKIWSEENRYKYMLLAEAAHLQESMNAGVIPEIDLSKLYDFNFDEDSIEKIKEIERETKHETLAFLTFLEDKFPNETKFMHYGLTSSDILDTALSMQIMSAKQRCIFKIQNLKATLSSLIQKYKATPMIGRSHGMYAEVTTFGTILQGHLQEINRIYSSYNFNIPGKFSGPVGNNIYSSKEIEINSCIDLDLEASWFATQVIPRDIHAKCIVDNAFLASAIERIATTIRHLQRPEIDEVCEGFSKNQKGSSAMPHKRNPILCENLCGLARVVRSMIQPSFENINLWHERDMTHSSVERFIMPESYSTVEFMVDRMNEILTNLIVKEDKMLEKLKDDSFASHAILLTLIRSKVSRQKAYKIVQEASFKAKKHNSSLKQEIKKISNLDFDICFDIQAIANHCANQIDKYNQDLY